MHLKLTDAEWMERYKPLCDAEGAPKQFDCHDAGDWETIRQAMQERKIWTMHHGEYDTLFVLNGFNVVNRLDYHITEVAWQEGDVIEVEDEEQVRNLCCPWCEREEDDVPFERLKAVYDGASCGEGCEGDEGVFETFEEFFGGLGVRKEEA